jgi:hypothetical protein
MIRAHQRILKRPPRHRWAMLRAAIDPQLKARYSQFTKGCHSTAALLTTSCVHHDVNNREDSGACNVASSAVSRCFDPRRPSPPWVPLRLVFRRKTLELPLTWSQAEGLARWLAWEKAWKDWLAKGVCGGLGASRGAKRGPVWFSRRPLFVLQANSCKNRQKRKFRSYGTLLN